MSRSHKYHPFGHICKGRNSPWKKMANRKFRRLNRLAVKNNLNKLLHRLRECSNVYDFPTDGLAYYQDPNSWKKCKVWKDMDLKEIYKRIIRK